MSLKRMVLALALVGIVGSAGAQELSMTVDASKTGAPIHPYRKFFYPVDSSEELDPIYRKRNFERWRPIGPDESPRSPGGVVSSSKRTSVFSGWPGTCLRATGAQSARPARSPSAGRWSSMRPAPRQWNS